jgi:membrane protease YdiL (CAAX protease family)
MSDFNDNPNTDEENETPRGLEDPGFSENPPLISPIAAAFLGLIGGFLLYQLVGGLLTLLVFGFDLEAAPVNGLRLMTIAGQILFILLPALVFTKWIYNDVASIIYTKMPNWKEILLFSFGIIVLTPLLQSYLYIQNYFIESLAANFEFVQSIKSLLDSFDELITKTYSNLLTADNVPEMFLVIIAVSIVPAICEEVMFRGYIQRSFEFKIKPIWAALVTAVFFSLYHFNPYGLLPLMVLGFYFGFAAYMSKSIVIPITLHFLNNFSAVLLFFIIGDDGLIRSNVVDADAIESHLLYFSFLIVLFGFIIFLIRKYYSQVKNI